MDSLILAVGIAVLSALLLGALGAVVAWKHHRALLEAVFRPWNEATQQRLDFLEEFVETLPGLYEGFATEARKARQRATWHVSRVKKELDKLGLRDPEMDELAGNLRPVDGEGSGDRGLLALHSHVAESPPPSQSDEMDDLARRKFGA